jgi:hypothetical protein
VAAVVSVVAAGSFAFLAAVSGAAPKSGTAAGSTHVAGAPQIIYDSTLRVFWAANADLPATHKYGLTGINADGSMSYATAKAWVRRLNKHRYLGHKDWTLPITPTPYKDKKC